MKKTAVLTALLVLLLCGCAGTEAASEPTEAAKAAPAAVSTEAPTPEPTEVPTPEPTAVPTVSVGPLVLEAGTAEADLSGIGEETDAAIRELIDAAEVLGSLRTVDLGGYVPEYELYRELSEAYPEAEIRLSLSLLGEPVDREARSLDLHAMSAADTPELLRVLPYMSGLEEINFVSESGECVYSLDDIAQLDRVREAVPDVKLHVAFKLFGKQVTSEDERIEYLHNKKIGDEGIKTVRSVMPYLSSCTYFLVDDCGVSNEVMAELRDDFPDRKVVWRVWITKPNYKNKRSVRRCSFLTDTQRIRTTYIRPNNVKVLKYCTETKYIDFGHNRFMSDFWFLAYMPKLEVCIIAMTEVKDLTPFASCPELEFLEVFTTNITTLKPLANCKKLQYLNIANCPKLKDITALYELKNLKVLRMVCTSKVPKEQKREVAKRLPDCKILKDDPYNPTGGGWRKGKRYRLLREQMEYDIDREEYGIP